MSFADDLEAGRSRLPSRQAGGGPSSGAEGSDTEMRDFAALSHRISQAIYSVSANVAQVQRMLGSVGGASTAAGEVDMGHRLQQLLESTRELIRTTTDDLRRLNRFDADSAGGDAARYSQGKLARDFQHVAQQFQSVQKVAAEKERQLVSSARHFIEDDERATEDEATAQWRGAGVQQQQVQQRKQVLVDDGQIAFNEALIAEREREIQDIETGIVELNDIFRDLGTIVTEQGEHLDNIESNISSTATHVMNADGQLTRAARYQRRTGKRLLCLLVILAVILALVLLAILL